MTVLPLLAVAALPAGVVVRPLTRPTVQRRVVAHVVADRRRHALVDLAVERLRCSASGG